jgi:hypothetical protein
LSLSKSNIKPRSAYSTATSAANIKSSDSSKFDIKHSFFASSPAIGGTEPTMFLVPNEKPAPVNAMAFPVEIRRLSNSVSTS